MSYDSGLDFLRPSAGVTVEYYYTKRIGNTLRAIDLKVAVAQALAFEQLDTRNIVALIKQKAREKGPQQEQFVLKAAANSETFKAVKQTDLPEKMIEQVEVTDAAGKTHIQKNVKVEQLSDVEKQALDRVVDQVRSQQVQLAATQQEETGRPREERFATGSEEATAQAAKSSQKKRPGVVPGVGAGRETESASQRRYADQQASREKAKEKRRANEKYTESLQKQHGIVEKGVRDFEKKKGHEKGEHRKRSEGA